MAKNRVNFATYPQDYYTGAQVHIYFGSVWVDDIATIQYQTSHSKTPLYGYADHQFRAVAKGQFLVRGSFTVALKENGYLYSIMQLIRNDKSGESIGEIVNGSDGKPTNKSINTYLDYLSQGYTVENMLDEAANNERTSETFGFAGKTSDFEDISEVLENAIWGRPGTPASFSRKIPRSDELDYYSYIHPTSVSTDIDSNGFDILLTFGNYKMGSDSPEHTMISINDVHITGESLVASPSAEPIGITYEFFARGINEKVSSAWPGPDQIVAKTADEDKKTEPEKQVQKKVASEPVPSKDITSGDTPDPAQNFKTKEVTQTSEAPKTVSEFVRQTQEAQLYTPKTTDDLLTVATGQFQEIEIKGTAPGKSKTISVTKPDALITPRKSVAASAPAEVPNVSFNVKVKGDMNVAFEKALIAAPSENVQITGNVSSGGTLVKTKFFKDLFRGRYSVYGDVIHINVDYVLAGQFGIAKNQIIQFFANLK